MNAVPKWEGGSGLIEVVVALVIFIVIVLGLGNSIVSARRTGYSSREIAEATTLAVDKLEHLRTLLLIDSQMTAGTHTDSANPLAPDGSTGGIYTRRWTITSNIPVVGMKRIEMSVSWNDRGSSRSITLVSLLPLL